MGDHSTWFTVMSGEFAAAPAMPLLRHLDSALSHHRLRPLLWR